MIHGIKRNIIFRFFLTTVIIFGVCFLQKPANALVLPAAELLRKFDTSAPVRNMVIHSALQLIGLPYRRGGDGEYGFDCSGFVHRVLAEQGFRVPRSSRDFYRAGQKIPLQRAKKGDLLFFQTRRGRVSHVGIYMGNGQFVHSAYGGVKVSNLSDAYYKCRYIGATALFSYPKLG